MSGRKSSERLGHGSRAVDVSRWQDTSMHSGIRALEYSSIRAFEQNRAETHGHWSANDRPDWLTSQATLREIDKGLRTSGQTKQREIIRLCSHRLYQLAIQRGRATSLGMKL